MSTVRAALELKSVFAELAKAETSGITEERKKELEEKAATKGMQALFKGASLEVESVLRDVCDRVLSGQAGNDETASTTGGGGGSKSSAAVTTTAGGERLSKETQRLRAIALGIVGNVFLEVKAGNEGGSGEADGEYVRVDKAKKEGQ